MISNELLLLLGGPFAGLILGILASTLFWRKAWQQEANQSQAHLQQFNEEKAANAELYKQIQTQLQLAAKLEEQASRLPVLEAELTDTKIRLQALGEHFSDLRHAHGAAESTLRERDAQIVRIKRNFAELQDELKKSQVDAHALKNELTKTQAALDAEIKQGAEKLDLLNEAKAELSNRFKTLANDILEEKTERFTTYNQQNMKQILEPLKTKITDFQNQVEKAYHQEGKDRSELKAQVVQLMDMNRKLSDDANHLASALKGQAKIRGNWGELILERVLEASGLRKDHEYTVQENHARSDGSRVQPDVVIHLPDDKHLVIDSKVTLNPYLKYTEADDETQRAIAIKQHLQSIRAHIIGLSGKHYHELYGIKSPDFVIMFIPIEPAFSLAISHDIALWQDAWNKNILIVSPSTLLFVIRTVAHIWRQEKQNQNAQKIAERGALLYDKFKGFIEDMERIGERIQQTQGSYEQARKKLYSGTGNLIRQAEQLKELGVKPKQSIKAELIEEAQTEMALPSEQA